MKIIKKGIKIINFLRRPGKVHCDVEALKKEGMIVGKNFNVQNGCILDGARPWLIEIGDNVVLAPNVHILTHDTSTKKYGGYVHIGRVNIKDNVFIGASSVVLLGVTIGENSIIGAGSVVTKDVKPNSVYAGNPAKFICSIDDYIEKHAEPKLVYKYPRFKKDSISNSDKQQMKAELYHSNGYSGDY